MKNKSKLNKIKNNSSVKLPDGWFFMSKESISVSDIKNVLDRGNYDVEVWCDMGVLEIILGEKLSVDIEDIGIKFNDEYSDKFVDDNNIKSVFYIAFKNEIYDKAREVFVLMSKELNGFVCGDTEDFSPIIK